jgi:IgA Peptidase M64
MSTSDGAVGTATKVVDNGPGGRRWDLVVMGDGYRRGELSKFHDDVEWFWAEVLKPTPPFDQLWPAINVHRVDVTSAQSGADMPCNGEGPFRTFFDASYCDPIWGPGASEWLLTVNEPLAKQVAGRSRPGMERDDAAGERRGVRRLGRTPGSGGLDGLRQAHRAA